MKKITIIIMLLACISLSVTHHNCYLINTDFFIPPSMRDAKTKNQSSNIKATVERERERNLSVYAVSCCGATLNEMKLTAEETLFT